MEHNRQRDVASEHDTCSELAELDRILAGLKAEEDCTIATSSLPTDRAVPQEPAGIAPSAQSSATVGSLPSTPISTCEGKDEAAAEFPVKRRGTKLQAAVEELLPSLEKPWRRLWAHEKLARSFQVAEAGGGVTFNLHLSAGIQKTLSSHLDPARLMSLYINRELRSRLGKCPPYGFAFDVTAKGRVHLHGIVIPLVMDVEHLEALDKALMAAGGRIKGPAIVRQTQNYMDICHDGVGWAAYSQKTFDQMAQLLGTRKVTFISRSLVHLCRATERR